MNNNHNNGFSNGFLLGLIVGAALVFLLGTEKGKKIVKAITENGLDKMDEIRDLLEESMEEIEDEYEQPVEPSPKKIKSSSNGHATNSHAAATAPAPSGESVALRAKRLFRGIPKRR